MKNSTLRRTITIIILLSLVLVIYMLIISNKIQSFDSGVYNIISKVISQPLTILAKVITTIGSVYVIGPLCLILTILFWKKGYGKYIFINLCIIVLINQGLKFVIQRPRPIENNLIVESGFSFPSGHSMVGMSFYGDIIYLIYKKVKNNYLKWVGIVLLSIIIVLIGLSRIYLGVHYASDVLAGFLISIAYLSIKWNLLFKLRYFQKYRNLKDC